METIISQVALCRLSEHNCKGSIGVSEDGQMSARDNCIRAELTRVRARIKAETNMAGRIVELCKTLGQKSANPSEFKAE